jgi:hypothetical protein
MSAETWLVNAIDSALFMSNEQNTPAPETWHEAHRMSLAGDRACT